MSNIVVLYRNCASLSEDTLEHEAIQAAGLKLIRSRMEIQPGDLVIPRFSAIPFYKELVNDVRTIGARLINNLSQHKYITDLQNYVVDLDELTPDTWDRLEVLPDDCSFVLKGATNSRKHDWNQLMFAKDKKAAIEVHSRLCQDGLIGYQTIYIRRYVPLKTYMVGIKDLPITKEFRFFICNRKVLTGAYYWSSHADDLKQEGIVPDPKEVPESFLTEVINRIGNSANFYTIDVAQTADDRWIVIELNLGEQAGLSENDPYLFYRELKNAIG